MDNSRILDDLTRVAGGAFSIFSTLGQQIQSHLKDQMGDKFSSSAGNDDVARLQGVVTKLRLEQEELKKRIAELESGSPKKADKKSAKQPALKVKATSKKSVAPSKSKPKTKKRA